MVADDDPDGEFDTSSVIGCSVRGKKSVDREVPCQDGNEKRTLPGDRYIIAAADGLGSASLSHVGSDKATHAAVEFIESNLAGTQSIDWATLDPVFTNAFEYAREELQAEADSLGKPVSKLNTTLLVAVGGPDGVAGAAVGDGGIVWHRCGQNRLLIPREETEYGNETIPLQSEHWQKSYRFGWVADADAAAVFSDGLDSVAWDGPASVSDELFDQVFNNVRESSNPDRLEQFLRDFLNGESLRRSSRDDKTLVVGALPAAEWTDPAGVNPQYEPTGNYPEEQKATADPASTGQTSSSPFQGMEHRQTPEKVGKVNSALGEQVSGGKRRRISPTLGIAVLVGAVVVAGVFLVWSPLDTGDGNSQQQLEELSIGNVTVADEAVQRGEDITATVEVEGLPEGENGPDLNMSLELGGDSEVFHSDTWQNATAGKTPFELSGELPRSATAVKAESHTVTVEVETTDGGTNDTATQEVSVSNPIQAAVDFAEENNEDTVMVQEGIYEEPVIVDVPDLAVQASGKSEVEIESPNENPAVSVTAGNVTITGFSIDGSDLGVNLTDSAGGAVINENNVSSSVVVQATAGTGSIEIENNEFSTQSSSKSAIRLDIKRDTETNDEINITGNNFSGYNTAVILSPGAAELNLSRIQLRNNRFEQDSTAIGQPPDNVDGTLNATENWWGSRTGPDGNDITDNETDHEAGGDGATIMTEQVTFVPWLKNDGEPVELDVPDSINTEADMSVHEDGTFNITVVNEIGDPIDKVSVSNNRTEESKKTDEDGRAEFAVTEEPGQYQVELVVEAESTGGLEQDITHKPEITVVGDATAVRIEEGPPEDVTAGEEFPIDVEAVHNQENPVPGVSVDAVVDDDEEIWCDSVETDDSGVASFNITIENAGNGYKLNVSIDMDSGRVNDSNSTELEFNVTTAAPSNITITDEPEEVSTDEAFNITISAKDQFGNVAANKPLEGFVLRLPDADHGPLVERAVELNETGKKTIQVDEEFQQKGEITIEATANNIEEDKTDEVKVTVT